MKNALRLSAVVSVALIALLALSLAPLHVTPALASHGVTLVVDDDGVQCENAGYRSIQKAVDDALPTTTIEVCEGTYDEQVEITTDNLTIVGEGATTTFIRPTTPTNNTTTLANGTKMAAIVLVDGAQDVRLEGFTVNGESAECSPGAVGVYYRNASGALEAANVVNVWDEDRTGCQKMLAVFAESNDAGQASLSVADSTVALYGKNGISCNGPNTDCEVVGNEVAGRGVVERGDAAQNGIQIGFGATGFVSENFIHDHYYGPETFAAAGILVVHGGGSNTNAGAVVIPPTNEFANNQVDILRGPVCGQCVSP